MPALQRDKINPAFRSKYLSLEALLGEVLPVLNKHGLALIQLPSFVYTSGALAAVPALTTRLVHDESGESIETTMLLLASKSDPQGQGSAITYARRYSLMSMLGLSADEDDDGNAASSQRGARKLAAASTANGAKKITAAQLTRLHTLVGAHGLSADSARALIRNIGGVESSKDIPAAKYDAIIAEITKLPEAAQ
jgi:hypothetical protein